MSDELYQELILEHARHPHNAEPLSNAKSTREHNTLCGDALTLFLRTKDGAVEQVSAVTSGCALSKASASLMTDILRGKTEAEATKLIELVSRVARGERDADGADLVLPEDLKPLASVAGYPARVKCVTMSWHAAKKLLSNHATE